jgi:hypothetical protein
MFRKATKSLSKLRLALTGPSGSGKTYSALMIAQGLSDSIAMIDTERGSGELYSDLLNYDVLQLAPPFDPEKYIQAIKAAETAGYETIIIDSLSHAWAGEGGILEIHDRVAKSTRNSFAAWREVTPMHNALVDAMLQSSCHIIVTMRTKTAYEVQQDDKKTRVIKVGLAPVQRDGLEYEFTLVLDLSVEGHIASSSKDRTGLFDGKYFVPSTDTGKELLNWLSGNKNNVKPIKQLLISDLYHLLTEMGLDGYTNGYSDYLLSRYQVQELDQLLPKNIQEQVTLLKQCGKNQQKCRQFIKLLQQPKAA